MKKSKRRLITWLAALCIVFILAAPSLAHPGRTDSRGGHTNHSTGEYHYHHGYPEHQHTNGVCPYDFKDKTGSSSGSSGGISPKKQDKSVASTSPTEIKEETRKESDSTETKDISLIISKWTAIILLGFPFLFGIIFYLFECIKNAVEWISKKIRK